MRASFRSRALPTWNISSFTVAVGVPMVPPYAVSQKSVVTRHPCYLGALWALKSPSPGITTPISLKTNLSLGRLTQYTSANTQVCFLETAPTWQHKIAVCLYPTGLMCGLCPYWHLTGKPFNHRHLLSC